MEQDEVVYQYLMGPEVFRFECHSDNEAKKYREYALIHFRDKLGNFFEMDAIRGPERVLPSPSFQAEV